ncbi:SDR family NAD(P)-dependent oxidoreductase [Pseudomonas sp. UL073]|uniref:SDR family NAD(P)-dependent oxidoreductase n=1 Tax=Zestomonas insulae TaxID=2809017 RepID=A0ABS2I8Z8_9GAMM|nr:SDR family NAD(P)-dependent oxidoreductase [Pseudomonas insulae]MBM7059611.1 SDR family NAD(P)-dependent oxidoreductase [Pseudomonas insulae]
MNNDLLGRVIAVTGAFGSLGRAIAAAALARGASVVMLDRATAPTEALLDAPERVLLLGGTDLTDGDATQRAMAQIHRHFGRLDSLVNAAGGFRWETLEEGDLLSWDFLYQINLRTTVTACKAALPALRQSPAGRIVNIGAAAASKAGCGMGAYAASKAGVARLTESLADELKDAGITVNAVLPSILDTPPNRQDMPDADFSRWVTPAALAAVVMFLLSDAASAVTGACLPVVGRV